MSRAIKGSSRVREQGQPLSGRLLIAVPRAWRRRIERTTNLFESFYHAMQGLAVAFQGERNLRIQSVLAVIAVSLAIALHCDPISFAMLFLAIGLVITAELLNTAVERAVDMFTGGEFHRLAKDAKDVAADAVVCASVTSLAIGAAIFLPRLYSLFVSLH